MSNGYKVKPVQSGVVRYFLQAMILLAANVSMASPASNASRESAVPARSDGPSASSATPASQVITGFPSFDQVRAAYQSSDLQLVDRQGLPLQRVRVDRTVRRLGWVKLQHVSPGLQAALLAAEDKRFYDHGGVDWAAAAQAAWDNLRHGGKPSEEASTKASTKSQNKTQATTPTQEQIKAPVARGASTLSMQLAALLDPTLKPTVRQRRTLGQKWDQAKAAWEIERVWSKAQIFEAYLNLLPLRGEAVGISAAAEIWFGKLPDGLDLSESVLLAALVRQPQASPGKVGERACGIIAALDPAVLPMLTRPPCGEVKSLASLVLSRPQMAMLPDSLAPHAARLALAELMAGKLPKPPASSNASPLPTTLDAKLQYFVRERLDQQLRELVGRNVEDGAVVVLDNASGEVLAWVGSSGALSTAAEVDGVTALRQAGSTLKPFLYALALDRRLLTAASLVDDSPVALTAENGVYVPQNYDRQFRGWVSVRTALASSLNIPAVRTLLMTGTDRFYEQLKRFGFSSLSETADYYGLALALGSAEVRLVDLANAYRALANEGRWSPVAPFIKGAKRVSTADRRVLGAGAAFIISDILADRGARAPGFGLENALATRVWAAVKTGTSKDMRDNWAIGYTRRYTVAVWVGNFSGASMWNVSGIHGAAPLWRDIVHFLHETSPGQRPSRPAGIVSAQVRFEDIKEASRLEYFLHGTAMSVVARNIQSGRPSGTAPDASLGMEADFSAELASGGEPRIVYPAEGLIVALDPDIPDDMEQIPLRMQAWHPDYSWRLNRQGTPDCTITPDGANWPPEPGRWTLNLFDQNGKSVDSVTFSVRGRSRRLSTCQSLDSAAMAFDRGGMAGAMQNPTGN